MYISEEMEQLAFDSGISVEYTPLSCRQAEAMVFRGFGFITVDPRRNDTNAKKAVAIAHEMGHIRTSTFPPAKDTRAWRWAIKTLLPRRLLTFMLRKCDGHRWEVAEELDLPEEFVERAMVLYFAC